MKIFGKKTRYLANIIFFICSSLNFAGNLKFIPKKIIEQFDKKIIICGNLFFNNTCRFCLIRLTENGFFDESFDGLGIVIDRSNQFSYVSDICIQNRNIIVAGYSFSKVTKFLLARYQYQGLLDKSFGYDETGYVIDPISDYSEIKKICLNNNYIIVIGMAIEKGYSKIAFSRYKYNGILDKSFGNNGVKMFDIGLSLSCNSMSVKSNNIIIGGSSLFSGDHRLTLMKINTLGELNFNFANHGLYIDSFRNNGSVNSIDFTKDGNIVVAGINNDQVILEKYDNTGQLIADFGKEILQFKLKEIKKILFDHEDMLILCGMKNDNSYFLSKLDQNGFVNKNFTRNAALSLNGFYGSDISLCLTNDGKILCIGQYKNGFFVCKLDHNALVDNNFAVNGILAVDNFDNFITIQENGQIKAIPNTIKKSCKEYYFNAKDMINYKDNKFDNLEILNNVNVSVKAISPSINSSSVIFTLFLDDNKYKNMQLKLNFIVKSDNSGCFKVRAKIWCIESHKFFNKDLPNDITINSDSLSISKNDNYEYQYITVILPLKTLLLKNYENNLVIAIDRIAPETNEYKSDIFIASAIVHLDWNRL